MTAFQSYKSDVARWAFAKQYSIPVNTLSVCPVCYADSSKKKSFYCADCSMKKSYSNRPTIQQLMDALNSCRSEKAHLSEQLNQAAQAGDSEVMAKLECMRYEVQKLRNRVSQLTVWNKDRETRLCELKTVSKDRRSAQLRHGEKYSKGLENIRCFQKCLEEAFSRTSQGYEELYVAQCKMTLELFYYVVPLMRIESVPVEVSTGNNVKEESDNLIAIQLAEAQRWAYLNGCWVEANPATITPTSGYKILTALVPPDGSCLSYSPFAVDSINQNAASTVSDASFSSQGPGMLLSKDLVVGFSYMNQLTSSIASIFHQFLPFPLAIWHKDVLCGRLSAEQFRLYAARLSANVCFICLCLGLDSSKLRPLNPAHNLWLLFEYIQNMDFSKRPKLLREINRGLSLEGEPELQRLLDNSNADTLLANIVSPLCASITDPSFFECMPEDEEWVMDGIDNYTDYNNLHTDSFTSSTNPLLPSTITSALFSFIRGRSTSQS